MSEDHALKRIERMVQSPAATGLLTLMETISEDHYCAGWMSGLEFDLWRMVQGGDRSYGFYPVSEERVEALRWLSSHASGWWIWDRVDLAAKFVPKHQWRPMFKRHEQARADTAASPRQRLPGDGS